MNHSYPLQRELNLTTKGVPTGHVKGLIDFMLGPIGQKVVADEGFVPLAPAN